MTQPAKATPPYIHALLFFCVFSLLACYLYSIARSPFTIFHSDPLNGFLALKNWEAGGAFNYIESVRATNISQTNHEFLTWWSPGQYLLPFALKNLLHLSFIQSVKATVMLGMILFIPGVIYLFRYFGFSLTVSLCCILIFLLQRMFFINTWGYDGGDILFISFLPWYLLVLMKTLDGHLYFIQFLVVFTLTVLAIFLKLTFIVVSLSVLFYLLVSSWSLNRTFQENLKSLFTKRNLAPALGILSALAVVYLGFLAQGTNPNHFNGMHFRLKDSIELLLMPLSIFSFTGLTTYLLGKSVVLAIFFYLILFIAIFFVAKMVMQERHEKYKKLILSFAIVFFLYFFYSFNFANVSGGDRHVRLVSFLCLPLIIQFLESRREKISFLLIAAVLCTGTAYSFFSVYKFKRQTAAHPVVGLTGFDYHTQVGESLSRELLDTLIRIDSENKKAIFLTDNFHWALDSHFSRFGMIGNEFLSRGFDVLPPKGSNVYILLNTGVYQTSGFFKENRYHFNTLMSSGENTLLHLDND